jgi:hypothetical protein
VTEELKKPWYRQADKLIPLVVSIIALGLAITTTVISEQRVARQERHATQAELRGVVQQLLDLPRQNAELAAKYRQDPATMVQVGRQIQSELVLLAEQAQELMTGLGTPSAAESYGVAYALVAAGQWLEAQTVAEAALRRAGNEPVVEAALRRLDAGMLFATGQTSQARAQLQRAEDVFVGTEEETAWVGAYNRLTTETQWAVAEAQAGSCAEAQRHLIRAQNTLVRLNILQDPQVQQAAAAVAQVCPT